MAFGRVGEPWWDEVWLVGGGPSLAGFDFECLRGRTVVAVNDSMLHLPWAAAVVSVDRNWIRHRTPQLREFAGEKFLIFPEDDEQPDIQGATFLHRSVRAGLSEDPGTIYLGGNSGFAALGVAYLKRACTIHLLGYDYSNGSEHWYSPYQWGGCANGNVYENWAGEFDETLPQLSKAGIEVMNHNPLSRIKAFERMEIIC